MTCDTVTFLFRARIIAKCEIEIAFCEIRPVAMPLPRRNKAAVLEKNMQRAGFRFRCAGIGPGTGAKEVPEMRKFAPGDVGDRLLHDDNFNVPFSPQHVNAHIVGVTDEQQINRGPDQSKVVNS